MRRQWFYILLSLAAQDRHGSAIMRDVLDLTSGELKLWPVTLYGSLDELADEGYIRELPAPPPGAEVTSERLRWFRISGQGRKALSHEVARMQATARIATERLAQARPR
jgi:DNA-binding PadR family transcriptional regulator